MDIQSKKVLVIGAARSGIKTTEFLLSKGAIVYLNDLKDKSGLSNQQWDKGIKALGQLGLTKVTKTDDALLVEVVE